jgi:hypothetical protein
VQGYISTGLEFKLVKPTEVSQSSPDADKAQSAAAVETISQPTAPFSTPQLNTAASPAESIPALTPNRPSSTQVERQTQVQSNAAQRPAETQQPLEREQYDQLIVVIVPIGLVALLGSAALFLYLRVNKKQTTDNPTLVDQFSGNDSALPKQSEQLELTNINEPTFVPSQTVSITPSGQSTKIQDLPTHVSYNSYFQRLTVRPLRVFLFDEKGKPISVSRVRNVYLTLSNLALVIYPGKSGFMSPQPARGIVYNLPQDVRFLGVLNQSSQTKTRVGKTIGRMMLSGLAAGLLTGGRSGSGLGGALLDYRIAGKEQVVVTDVSARIVLRDFSIFDITCSDSDFEKLCSSLPSELFGDEADRDVSEHLDKIERMANDGPRIYPELIDCISGLKKDIESTTFEVQEGKTFSERDKARQKLEGLKAELRDQEAYLQAVRYLIELQATLVS